MGRPAGPRAVTTAKGRDTASGVCFCAAGAKPTRASPPPPTAVGGGIKSRALNAAALWRRIDARATPEASAMLGEHTDKPRNAGDDKEPRTGQRGKPRPCGGSA